jgi:hypothetical protein
MIARFGPLLEAPDQTPLREGLRSDRTAGLQAASMAVPGARHSAAPIVRGAHRMSMAKINAQHMAKVTSPEEFARSSKRPPRPLPLRALGVVPT